MDRYYKCSGFNMVNEGMSQSSTLNPLPMGTNEVKKKLYGSFYRRQNVVLSLT